MGLRSCMYWVRTDPSRACSRLLASILGLLFICVGWPQSERDLGLLLSHHLVNHKERPPNPTTLIYPARFACRKLHVPRPFRHLSHFPASSLSKSPSPSPCGVLGLVLSTLAQLLIVVACQPSRHAAHTTIIRHGRHDQARSQPD